MPVLLTVVTEKSLNLIFTNIPDVKLYLPNYDEIVKIIPGNMKQKIEFINKKLELTPDTTTMENDAISFFDLFGKNAIE